MAEGRPPEDAAREPAVDGDEPATERPDAGEQQAGEQPSGADVRGSPGWLDALLTGASEGGSDDRLADPPADLGPVVSSDDPAPVEDRDPPPVDREGRDAEVFYDTPASLEEDTPASLEEDTPASLEEDTPASLDSAREAEDLEPTISREPQVEAGEPQVEAGEPQEAALDAGVDQEDVAGEGEPEDVSSAGAAGVAGGEDGDESFEEVELLADDLIVEEVSGADVAAPPPPPDPYGPYRTVGDESLSQDELAAAPATSVPSALDEPDGAVSVETAEVAATLGEIAPEGLPAGELAGGSVPEVEPAAAPEQPQSPPAEPEVSEPTDQAAAQRGAAGSLDESAVETSEQDESVERQGPAEGGQEAEDAPEPAAESSPDRSADEQSWAAFEPELLPVRAFEEPTAYALEQALEADLDAREQRISRELDHVNDPNDRALLQHGLADLLERAGRIDDALAGYADARQSAPILGPSTWASLRLLHREERWADLVRLFDERLLEQDDPRRRAEILLEKGWICADRLDDVVQATDCFWAAHDLDPRSPLPLLAMERLALVGGDYALLIRVRTLIAESSLEPHRRAAALRQLALDLQADDPHRALELLRSAAELVDDRLPVLQQMELLVSRAPLQAERAEVLADLGHAVANGGGNPLTAAVHLREAALWHARQDHLERARELLERALELSGEDPLFAAELVRVCARGGDPARAVELLEHRIERAERPAERAAAAFEIALLEGNGDNPEAARAALERACSFDPDYAPAVVALERMAESSADWGGLARLWERAATIESERSEEGDAWSAADDFYRAALLTRYGAGDAEHAVELCRRAVAVRSEHGSAGALLALLLEELGRYEELLELWESEAQGAEPERATLLRELQLAIAGGPLDDPRRALQLIRQLRRDRPDDLRLARRQSDLLARLDSHPELEAALKEQRELEITSEGRVDCLLRLAALYEGPLEQPELAVALYRTVLGEDPGNAHAFAAVEDLLQRRADGEQLEQLLRWASDATDDPQERAQLMLQRARLLESQDGRADEAVELCRNAADLHPSLTALRMLRYAARRAGRTAERVAALAAEADLLEAPAGRVRRRVELAEALAWGLDDADRAEQELERAADDGEIAENDEAQRACWWLAQGRLARRDYEQAASALGRLEPHVPQQIERLLREERGWILAGPLDRLGEAAPLWEQLATEDPRPVAPVLGLLRAALRQERPLEGADRLEHLAAVVEDPALAAALRARAASLLLQDGAGAAEPRMARVLELLQQAFRAEDGDPEALLQLSVWGPPAVRAEALTRATQQIDERLRRPLHLAVAAIWLQGDRPQQALQELQPLLVGEQDHLPALLLASVAAERLGAFAPAARLHMRCGAQLGDDTARLEAYRRAAELFERAGDPRGQRLALWQWLASEPATDEPFERLRALAQSSSDAEELERVLTARLGGVEDPAVRCALLIERAELRIDSMEAPRRALADLLEALRLEPDHSIALWRIAEVAEQLGAPGQAVEYYRRAYDAASDAEDKRAAVLRAARLLQRLRRFTEASELCEAFVGDAGGDEQTLEVWASALRAMGDHSGCAAVLSRLARSRSDSAARRATLRSLAELHLEQRKDPAAALDVLVESLRDAPADIELLGDLRRAAVAAGQAQRFRDQVDFAGQWLRRELSQQPLSIERYQQLMRLAEWNEDDQTLLATMGVLCCFNALDDAERALYERRAAMIGFAPRGELDGREILRVVQPIDARAPWLDLWTLIEEALPRLQPEVFPRDPGSLGVGRGERLARDTGGPVSQMIDTMAGASGLRDVDVYVSRDRPRIVAGIGGQQAVLVIGHEVAAAMGRAERFRVARVLALLRLRGLAFEHLSRAEIGGLLEAGLRMGGADHSIAGQAASAGPSPEELQRAMPRRLRRAVPLAAERIVQAGETLPIIDRWVDAVLMSADRIGMLAAGDVVASMQQLVEPLGAPTRRDPAANVDLLRRYPHPVQLLPFAVSESYLQLRRQLRI